MRAYLIILIIGLFFNILFSFIRYIIFLKKINVENNEKVDNKNNNLIIVIPCLREQNYIENTILHFKQICDNIPIVIITTQKEIAENVVGEITTQEVVKNKIINKYKNIYWVDYPYKNGYMAHQLNYMLNNIENIFGRKVDLKNTYLALYNADSKPNKDTFYNIKQKISEGNNVIQQYAYCMQNYDEISNILKGFSIYQSCFEIKTGLINGIINNDLFYTHVVGHGLIINLQTLKENNNFNTKFWCEDIYLGLQLKFNNEKITPLLTLENMETPNRLNKLIKQNAVWFKTTSEFWKIFKDIIKNDKVKNKIKGFIEIINEFKCAFNWLLFPFTIILGIIFSILKEQYIALLCIVMLYLTFIYQNIWIVFKIVNRFDNKYYKINIKTLFNVTLATLISNIGPIYAIIFNKKEKYKTER